MKKTTFIILLALLIGAGGTVYWWIVTPSATESETQDDQANETFWPPAVSQTESLQGDASSTTAGQTNSMPLTFPDNEIDISDWETYSNEQFGFEIKYPSNKVAVSERYVEEMKHMGEFGFYLRWHLGRVDITFGSSTAGLAVYVYEKDLETMLGLYGDKGKLTKVRADNTDLLFFLSGPYPVEQVLPHKRVFFGGDENRTYEIVFSEMSSEDMKLFQTILSSFKRIE